MDRKRETLSRDRLRSLDEVAREERRHHFRETTMTQRLDEALGLSELARDLRAAVKKAE